MDEQGTNEVDELMLAPVNVISRKRPKALWGVLAAVAVAAGALAVTSGGGDGATAPLLPIVLGGGGAARQSDAAADSMLAWVTYVPGDALPALGGEAPAYKLSGAIEDSQVQSLANALGLDGEVVQQDGQWTVTGADGAMLQVSAGAGATWWYSALGPDVAVGRPATGSSGSSGDASHEASCETTPEGAVVCESVTTPAPLPVDCAEVEVEAGDCPRSVEPPADLPSEDEARAIALDLLAATGIDTDDAVVTVDGPYDAWYVTVEPAIDGTASGLMANVSVGSEGIVTSAGGYLGTPERLGDYPLLDTRAAIDRLNEQMANGGGYYGGVGLARDIAVASDEDLPAYSCPSPGEGVTTTWCDDTALPPTTTVPTCKVQPDGSEICEGSGSGEAPPPALPECPDLVPPMDQPAPEALIEDCALVDPMPVPMPEPEPIEVVLTGASPILVLVPANDGSTDAYLVPGYRFTGDDGAQVDAPAIVDASLAGLTPTEPPVTGTFDTSIVPDPGGTDGGSTPPPGCEPLVEDDSAGTTHTIQPCDGIDPTVDPIPLPVGASPAMGVGYYVDVDVTVHCEWVTVEVDGRVWWADLIHDIGSWSTPTEGGTLTFSDADHAAFVGDVGRTKVADLVPYPGPGPRPLCA